jgi:hypothetical protein
LSKQFAGCIMTDAARSLVRLLHGDTSAQIRTVCQAARTTQCISFPLPSTGEYVVDRVLDASFSQDNACNTILQDILPRYSLFDLIQVHCAFFLSLDSFCSFFRGSSALLMIAGGPSSGKTYDLVVASNRPCLVESDCLLLNNSYSLVGLPSEEVGILPRLLISIFHQIQQSHPEKVGLVFLILTSTLFDFSCLWHRLHCVNPNLSISQLSRFQSRMH